MNGASVGDVQRIVNDAARNLSQQIQQLQISLQDLRRQVQVVDNELETLRRQTFGNTTADQKVNMMAAEIQRLNTRFSAVERFSQDMSNYLRTVEEERREEKDFQTGQER